MRARTIREGSVGLLILLGIGLFGGLVLWLRGFNPTERPYQLVAEFEDSMGVQVGTPVSFRGVPVGRVVSVVPTSNSVEVGIEITEQELRIPSDVLVETVESGLIGEMSIEITPRSPLTTGGETMDTAGEACDSTMILCDGDRLTGVVGPSYEELLRSARGIYEVLDDPDIVPQLKVLLEALSTTTTDAGQLAKEATLLTQELRAELDPLTTSVKAATDSTAIAAQEVEAAAQQFAVTATDINSLIGENRGVLVSTLDNVQVASLQLRNAAEVLGPTLQSGELVADLETLLSNAAAASGDLQTITASLNTPANLVLLQQTLESARDALTSAQKVMADIDELTGDPALRNQLRDLINGLGSLVSSTQSLEQQSEIAGVLTPLAQSVTQVPVSPPEVSTAQTVSQVTAQSGLVIVPETEADPRPVLVFDGERYILRPTDRLVTERLAD